MKSKQTNLTNWGLTFVLATVVFLGLVSFPKLREAQLPEPKDQSRAKSSANNIPGSQPEDLKQYELVKEERNRFFNVLTEKIKMGQIPSKSDQNVYFKVMANFLQFGKRAFDGYLNPEKKAEIIKDLKEAKENLLAHKNLNETLIKVGRDEEVNRDAHTGILKLLVEVEENMKSMTSERNISEATQQAPPAEIGNHQQPAASRGSNALGLNLFGPCTSEFLARTFGKNFEKYYELTSHPADPAEIALIRNNEWLGKMIYANFFGVFNVGYKLNQTITLYLEKEDEIVAYCANGKVIAVSKAWTGSSDSLLPSLAEKYGPIISQRLFFDDGLNKARSVPRKTAYLILNEQRVVITAVKTELALKDEFKVFYYEPTSLDQEIKLYSDWFDKAQTKANQRDKRAKDSLF